MRIFAAAACAALLLSACQEPAGVGLGLIDEEQSDPRVQTILLTDLDTVETSPVTLGIADPNSQVGQSRVLAGSVVDPEFGDASAVAYFDFLQADDLDGSRTGADVREAWIELGPGYVYGDTTTSLPLELRPIQGQWEAEGMFPLDTLFDVGEVLSVTEIMASDSLRRFDIPEAFLRANADLFVGDNFSDGFEGFALQVPGTYMPSPGAVIGLNTFETLGAGMRVVVLEDTLLYPLSDVFTSVQATPPSVPPSTFIPARSGSGVGIRFDADFSGVGITPLANARVLLPLEQSVLEVGSFVRPTSSRMLLFGVRTNDEGEDVLTRLAELVITDDFVGIAEDSRLLTQELQELILDTENQGFESYEIVPLPTLVGLDVFPVRLPLEGAARPPRITLTLVGESL